MDKSGESWVASIILVLNLVNLAELVQYCLKIILSKYLIIQQNIFFTEKYSNLSQIRV
jgi:hypothetical protein